MVNFQQVKGICKPCKERLCADEPFDCTAWQTDPWICKCCRESGNVEWQTDGTAKSSTCYFPPKASKEEKKAWRAFIQVCGDWSRSSEGAHIAAAREMTARAPAVLPTEETPADAKSSLWVFLKLRNGRQAVENASSDSAIPATFSRQSGDWSMNVNRPPTPPESPATAQAISLSSAGNTPAQGPQKSPLSESHFPQDETPPVKPTSPTTDEGVSQSIHDNDEHEDNAMLSITPKKRRRLHRGTRERTPSPGLVDQASVTVEPAASSPVIHMESQTSAIQPTASEAVSVGKEPDVSKRATDFKSHSPSPKRDSTPPKHGSTPPTTAASTIPPLSPVPPRPKSPDSAIPSTAQALPTVAVSTPIAPRPVIRKPVFDKDFFLTDMLKPRQERTPSPKRAGNPPAQQVSSGFTPINAPGQPAYPFLKQKRDHPDRRNSAFEMPLRPFGGIAATQAAAKPTAGKSSRKAQTLAPEGGAAAPPLKRRATAGPVQMASDLGVVSSGAATATTTTTTTTNGHKPVKRQSSNRPPTAQYPLRKLLPPGYTSPHEFPASARHRFPLTEEFYAHDYMWKVKQHVREAELQIAVCPTPKVGVRLMITGLGAISAPGQFAAEISRFCSLDRSQIRRFWITHLWMAEEQEGRCFTVEPEDGAEAYERMGREVAERFREEEGQCPATVYLQVELKQEPVVRQNPGGL